MRLKDKQTNKVDEYGFCQKVGNGDMIGVTVGSDLNNPIFFHSLSELCERFEDAPEEMKPFEEVVSSDKYRCAAPWDYNEPIVVADIDYYEILPDGTKKTEFTWDEAMEIEKKTHGKWRVPTQAEWYAIAAAFGRDEDGKITGETLAKNLNLATDEDGYGYFWSSSVYGTTDARYLGFDSTDVRPQSNNSKVNGFTVRCVAR